MLKLRTALLFSCFATLALAQTTPNWTQVRPATFPPARNSGGFTYDSAHSQAVLFGGQTFNGTGIFNLLDDTWFWDGTNFTLESPQTSPPGNFGLYMVYDSTHGQVVMFLGSSFFVGSNTATWLWDGTNWTEASAATAPSARTNFAMAFDSMHGQVVLFGGQDFATKQDLNDTWLWDGTNWTQAAPATSPSARASHNMVYDSAHGQVVLFGGTFINTSNFNSTNYGDTWVWDGTNWTQETPATSPSARNGQGMVFDSVHSLVVLFGGGNATSDTLTDTWAWDGTTWTEESPADSPTPRGGFVMAYDSVHDQTILFGGIDAQGFSLNDVWLLSFPPPSPVVSAVVNGASFVGGGVVPGEVATVFGTNLTSNAGINLTSGLPLPTIFLNNSVMVNGQAVALFAVDDVNGQQQINFQVPWEVASGPNAMVAVANNNMASASISVPVLAAQPGIFNYTVGGDTFGAILHASFATANTADPATPGEMVLIYCTGLGAVSPEPADGAAGNGEPITSPPTVMMGGMQATVSFSGLAPGFVGLYQINAEVPEGLAAGNQPVIVILAGASSNSVLLPVE